MKGSTVFSVMVVGNNPKELMEKYDMSLKVEPYKKYEFEKAEKMKENSITILNEIIKKPKNFNISDFQLDFLKEKIKDLKNQTPFEYYSELVNGLQIDANGDAWTDENPNGKWQTYKLGENLSIPLILKNGSKSYQSENQNIAWNKIHMVDKDLYGLVWDMVHNFKKPSNDKEEKIYNNMKDNMQYFSNFKDKNAYIKHSCSYWNYAYLDVNGWKDINDAKNPNDWVANYFNDFIKPLKPIDKISIFECTKDKSIS